LPTNPSPKTRTTPSRKTLAVILKNQKVLTKKYMKKIVFIIVFFQILFGELQVKGQNNSTVKIKSSSDSIQNLINNLSKIYGVEVINGSAMIKAMLPPDSIQNSYYKLSEIYGEVGNLSLNFGRDKLNDVVIEVEESGKKLIEKTITDRYGRFILKKLEYDKWYTVNFSKLGYYSRFIRIYTYSVPDSLKETRFNYSYLLSVNINLNKIVNKEMENPYLKDIGPSTDHALAVYMYKPVELKKRIFESNLNTKEEYTLIDVNGRKDSLEIVKGGIEKDLEFEKSTQNWERQVEKRLFAESDKKSKKQIEDIELSLKVQHLEKVKITQEKLLLAQTNKLNQSEIIAVKAVSASKQKELELLQQGKKIQELTIKNKEQELKQNQFEIQKQKQQKYYFLIGLLVVLIFASFIFRSLRIRSRQNRIISEQKTIVEEKQKEILDSIEYALRIQTAILPPNKIIKQYLENSFILYKPKDIVAGDFYWMETINDLVLFAACDCTGHGVPGAMVSVVCHNSLNRAVREFGLTEPAAILDKTAEIVIENFSKSEEDIKDGMDISLCAYNTKTKTLQWAGANNPLWLLQNGELIETKADKQPIGMNEDSRPFTNHTFKLNTTDTIYIFTDGFADQFGGETGQKKLTRKRFKDLIMSIQVKTLQEQGFTLDKFITEYRKEIEQIDDILVMGVKI
jgi:serine phosphatase RsbU (regulator of sigma subunit)